MLVREMLVLPKQKLETGEPSESWQGQNPKYYRSISACKLDVVQEDDNFLLQIFLLLPAHML